jgi:secreted trypsin-like serine protease
MMKYILLLIAALILGTNSQLEDDPNQVNPLNCGKRLREIDSTVAEKIVGGSDAILGDWGWQVSMNYSGRFICGGSLINSQWILTAARCVSSLTPSFYSLDIGHHDRSQKEPWAVTRNVKEIIKHPDYSSIKLTNDIALMKLSEPITYVRFDFNLNFFYLLK